MVMSRGILLTGAGVGIGAVLAWSLTRAMESLLYGVGASDPLTFALVAGLLAAVSAVACAIPAVRAARVDPMLGPCVGAASAQAPGVAPGGPPGGRSRRLCAGRDRPAGAGAARSRDSAADAGRARAGQRRGEAVRRRDKSSAQPLLKKFESLLMLQPPRLNVAATYTQTTQRMGPRHEGFVEIAKQGNIDLLLHGDSITDWWVQDANKPMFDKYFGSIKTANFAIAGDTTQGVLWGLKNGEGQGFQPKAVMLMIGTNNTGQSTAPEIAEGVGAVVMELRRNFPTAKILLLAIFPRSVPGDPVRDKIAEVNRIISRLDDRSTSSTWTSARSSSTRRASSCPTRSGPTTCTRRRRATTSGARPSAPSSRS